MQLRSVIRHITPLLREEKTVQMLSADFAHLAETDILIFPGSYDLPAVGATLPPTAYLHLDVAYDVGDLESLAKLPQPIQTILSIHIFFLIQVCRRRRFERSYPSMQRVRARCLDSQGEPWRRENGHRRQSGYRRIARSTWSHLKFCGCR